MACSATGSSRANAGLLGFNSSTSLVLYDRMLTEQRHGPMSSVYSREDVLAAVSHEIGHWAHGHIPKLFIFYQVCGTGIRQTDRRNW